jgi:midasin (ATPase involved in ribosome maturation)
MSAGKTGIFIRVNRNGQWLNLDVVDLTVYEFMKWFWTLSAEKQISVVLIVLALGAKP